MGGNVMALSLTLLVLCGVATSAPAATSPAKIVSGIISNHVAAFMKRLWSLKASTKTAISGRPMMKFETGYVVETVFDGSKLGIEPYAVEVLPNGELLILDSANSNLYRISSSLSLYSRAKLMAGSPDGYPGHVDGRAREARLNHPKGLTVDDRGNIYIADTVNMAIRKISDGGVTTIAGGKAGRGFGHVDGPSEDAKFSNDFDVVYVGSSCSLLVIDRGNRAIREIQLHFDDCAYQYDSGLPLGIAVLIAATFFGYMLALLQRRVGTIVSPEDDQEILKTGVKEDLYQKPVKSIRPPLIPMAEDQENQEESFFGSFGKLLANTGTSLMEIVGGVLPGLRKKSVSTRYQQKQSSWPVQESFVIPDEDEPPPPAGEPRTPTPRKTYAFMSKDAEKMPQLRQSRAFYSGWDGDITRQHQQQKHQYQQQKQQHHRRHYSSIPHTYYEQNCEKTNEIVFGAVQEQSTRREAIVARPPVDYGYPRHNYHSIRSRTNSLGYGYKHEY